jgi:hypothetical protein
VRKKSVVEIYENQEKFLEEILETFDVNRKKSTLC